MEDPAEETKICLMPTGRATDRAKVAQGYKFQTAAEMSAMPTTKDWLIKGVFARGESSAWIAPPGGMKSALLAEASICVGPGSTGTATATRAQWALSISRSSGRTSLGAACWPTSQRLGLAAAADLVVGDMIDPRNAKRIAATIQEAETPWACQSGWQSSTRSPS